MITTLRGRTDSAASSRAVSCAAGPSRRWRSWSFFLAAALPRLAGNIGSRRMTSTGPSNSCRPATPSPTTSRMRETISASSGSREARSSASARSAAITELRSKSVTSKPAAARSSESSPRPAVASTARSPLSQPLIRVARSRSSRPRRLGSKRGSRREKSARRLMPSAVRTSPSGSRRSAMPAGRLSLPVNSPPSALPAHQRNDRVPFTW